MTWQITIYFSDGQKPFVVNHFAEDRDATNRYAQQWFDASKAQQGLSFYEDETRFLMFRPEQVTRIEVSKGLENKQPVFGSK